MPGTLERLGWLNQECKLSFLGFEHETMSLGKMKTVCPRASFSLGLGIPSPHRLSNHPTECGLIPGLLYPTVQGTRKPGPKTCLSLYLYHGPWPPPLPQMEKQVGR